ncbi:hypothetical protein HispidOSU_014566 [Sigmodon hispidus]
MALEQKSAKKPPATRSRREVTASFWSPFPALPGCGGELSTSALRPRHLPPPQREEGRDTRTVEVICDP